MAKPHGSVLYVKKTPWLPFRLSTRKGADELRGDAGGELFDDEIEELDERFRRLACDPWRASARAGYFAQATLDIHDTTPPASRSWLPFARFIGAAR
jgi:hypothetical protein